MIGRAAISSSEESRIDVHPEERRREVEKNQVREVMRCLKNKAIYKTVYVV